MKSMRQFPDHVKLLKSTAATVSMMHNKFSEVTAKLEDLYNRNMPQEMQQAVSMKMQAKQQSLEAQKAKKEAEECFATSKEIAAKYTSQIQQLRQDIKTYYSSKPSILH